VFEQKFDRVLLSMPSSPNKGSTRIAFGFDINSLTKQKLHHLYVSCIRNEMTHFCSDIPSTSTYTIIDQHHESATDSARGMSITYPGSMMQRRGSHIGRD
jgi:hypothetical protein